VIGQHKFTDLEIFALIFAAMAHDLAHPGTTNNFHINAQTNLALLYNDRSVLGKFHGAHHDNLPVLYSPCCVIPYLENHHASSAFQILKNPTCNILEGLSRDEYKEFRELVIELILGTDMASHFQHIKTIRSYLQMKEW